MKIFSAMAGHTGRDTPGTTPRRNAVPASGRSAAERASKQKQRVKRVKYLERLNRTGR